jgi:hypothetical protein
MHKFPPKDPDSKLFYRFDWAALTNGTGDSDWLAEGETITSYSLIAAGITVDSDSLIDDDTAVLVKLSGGTAGTTVTVTCRIVTSTGQEEDKTAYFSIVG